MLFYTFRQQLAQHQHRVSCCSVPSKPALIFRQHMFRNSTDKSNQHNLGKNFSRTWEEGDTSAVSTYRSVPFLLVYAYYVAVFPLLWDRVGSQAFSMNAWSIFSTASPPCYVISAGRASGPGALLFFIYTTTPFSPTSDGVSARSLINGNSEIRLAKSGLVGVCL